MDQAPVIFY
uniref:Uncharacterized protein n=1 Tax=Arundo donax TaxID=35708 RepID=A0A0A9B9X1_ARUDO